MTPLRRRLLDEMALRHYSPRTVEAYLAAVVRLSNHFNCPPDRLDAEQIRAFQLDHAGLPAPAVGASSPVRVASGVDRWGGNPRGWNWPT